MLKMVETLKTDFSINSKAAFSYFGSIILALLGLGIWLKLTLNYASVGSDFTQDYLAAYSLLNNRHIYKGIEELGREYLNISGIVNNHTPFTALLFVPFSYLDHYYAFFIFNFMSLIFYLTMIYMIIKPYKPEYPIVAYILSLSLLWFPFMSIIGLGQISLLLCLLVFLSWLAWLKKKTFWCSFSLALAGAVKLFPLYLLLFFIIRKQFNVVLLTIIIFFIFQFIAIVCTGPTSYLYFVSDMALRNTFNFYAFPANYSFLGVFASLLQDNAWTSSSFSFSYKQLYLLHLLAVIVVTLMIAAAGRIKDEALFALCLIGTILASPISWIHFFPVILLGVVPLVMNYRKLSRPFKVLFILSCILISIPDIPLIKFLTNLYGLPLSTLSALLIKGPFWGLCLLSFVILKNNTLFRNKKIATTG